MSTSKEPALPRGIAPKTLIELVQSTAPFLFAPGWLDTHVLEAPARAPHLVRLLQVYAQLEAGQEPSLSHGAYFALCVSAHFATVTTFVPTDVDNQIRQKLWPASLPLETALEMKRLVLEARGWDIQALSRRVVTGPESGLKLTGHAGEWLTIAIPAYAILKMRKHPEAQEVADAVLDELKLEAAVYREFKRARNGMGLLWAATTIAHNLGDLDRVLDAWQVPSSDPLFRRVYRVGHEGPERFEGTLIEAGQLNKAMMAVENHRHLPLRAPRCLRRSEDFLLPIAPFLDAWGACVARHTLLSFEEKAEVVGALVDGWERLNQKPGGPVGYARALAGLLEQVPGGEQAIYAELPARYARVLKSGPLRSQLAQPRSRFEEQWASMALRFVSGKRA